jgi:succinate dehydrogenase/fumarate reductase cytochrome b subunit
MGRTQLLGREYYQTSFGERYLLLTPFFAHVGCGALKRLVSPRQPRPWTNALTATGYILAFFMVPLHYLTHRLLPSDPSPPINLFGPSELDYEFVKTAMHAWPVRVGVGYAVLSVMALAHMFEGMSILQRSIGIKSLSKTARKVATTVLALPILSGLLVLAREPLLTFGPRSVRFHGVFERLPLFFF